MSSQSTVRTGEIPIRPEYGKRLLPQVVDEIARIDPDRIYASFPLSTDLSKGFHDVTFKKLAQAVNHLAWWLEARFGRSTSSETVAYMGVPDLRAAVFFLAAVFLPSMRNPTITNVHLLEQTACAKFCYSVEMTPKVKELQRHMSGLNCIPVPALDEVLNATSEHYPYEETFEQSMWKPILVLHSSGSTGPPKAIVMNHGTFAAIENDRSLPQVPGRKIQSFASWDFNGGGKLYSPFPPFHLGGFISYVVIPVFSDSASLVLGPPLAPPNGSLTNEIMKYQKLRAIFCPPIVIDQLMQEPTGFERLSRLDFLVYAGGPLSPSTGDRLKDKVDLGQFYGATEYAQIHTFVPHPEDWGYLEWIPTVKADMQPSFEGTYELVLHNDPSIAMHRPLNFNFPDFKEWRTRDLFKPHPTKPNLWRYYGRSDDIIVFSNGQKFNPGPAESIIQGHPDISAAVIVGTGRSLAALIVEPNEITNLDPASLVREIWPTVEKANTQSPAYGRVIQSMIVVASVEKPFQRAPKGTVIRQLVATDYASAIDQLYTANETSSPGSLKAKSPAVLDDREATKNFVRDNVLRVLNGLEISDDDDFYVQGLDSVKTVELVSMLQSGFSDDGTIPPSLSKLSTRTIYTNPSISRLSEWIIRTVDSRSEEMDVDLKSDRKAEISAMIENYTKALPRKAPRAFDGARLADTNVVLTGSTGSLGSYLLQRLVEDRSISAIYCFDRSANARQQHERSFAERNVSADQLAKVNFVQVDFALNQFGLSTKQYAELSEKVDLIIHNAWEVNYNMHLSSFEHTHIRGVRSFVDWVIGSDRRPHIFFVSSISLVANWNTFHKGRVPEKIVEDSDVASPMGYAQSKFVAEQILSVAHQRSGVPVTILRLGQIAGPVTTPGVWKEQEWVPSMIKTSRSLGLIPDSLPGTVDWIPVDALASVIAELVHSQKKLDEIQVHNIVNPHPTQWSILIPTIQEAYSGSTLKPVPLGEWVDALKSVDATSDTELAARPALKILDFFESMLSQERDHWAKTEYETQQTVQASKTLAQLGPVNEKWMLVWLSQWA
ncbi:MAG: putative NRPS-like protein biosynthetic cluster [Peltula sp. TS41687]|nr:MAG: putative NRPS-like protein biosynthetic cluster [Peltula sp. TS41687]